MAKTKKTSKKTTNKAIKEELFRQAADEVRLVVLRRINLIWHRDDITIEQLKHALVQARGLQSKAAKILKCSRQWVNKRIHHWELEEFLEEIRQTNLDRAEEVLWLHIDDAMSLKATIFYLKTIGKDRGYIPESKVTAKVTPIEPITGLEIIDNPPNNETSNLVKSKAETSSESVG